MYQTISLIIPIYNAENTLKKCLDSITTCINNSDDIEIILVDDASTDNSVYIAKKYPFKLILNSVNRGPSICRNIGAKNSKGSIIIFTDSDVIWPIDGLKKISHIFHNQPNIKALMGTYTTKAGHSGIISQYRNIKHHYDLITSCNDTFALMGACCAIRKECFFSIGGFDENFKKATVEDVDLGIRLWKMGYKIRLYKELQVVHLKKYDLISMLKVDIFSRTIPWMGLILKYKFHKNDVATKLNDILSLFFVYILIILVIIISLSNGDFILLSLITGLVLTYLICFICNFRFIFYTYYHCNIRTTLLAIAIAPLRYFLYGLGIFLGTGSFLITKIRRHNYQENKPELTDSIA